MGNSWQGNKNPLEVSHIVFRSKKYNPRIHRKAPPTNPNVGVHGELYLLQPQGNWDFNLALLNEPISPTFHKERTWVWPHPSISNSGRWRFIGIPYWKCNNPGGHCYCEGPHPTKNFIMWSIFVCLKLTFLHVKIDGWKRIFLLGWPIFRCYV